jgi:capsular exopolysaccharide synthesis family protein
MVQSLSGTPVSDIEAIGPASVKIIEQAQIPLEPVGVSKYLTLIIAFFMGGFLGVMLAFGFEYMDQTFKSPQDVETFLNLPFLGSIPKKPRPESYQNLSDQIHLVMKDKGLKSLLITSTLPSEGVTTIVTNLGKYMSQRAGLKVLVIDANLRDPAIHKTLNIGNGTGLVDVLEGKITFEKPIMSLDSNLMVMTAGKTGLNPVTLLSSSKMSDVIKSAKEKYQTVLVDCANMKDFKDAAVLSSWVDGVVVVVAEGRTRRQAVKSAIAPLEQNKTNLLGIILTNRTFSIPRLIYDRV